MSKYINEEIEETVNSFNSAYSMLSRSYKEAFGKTLGYDDDLHYGKGDCELKQLRLDMRALLASSLQLKRLIEEEAKRQQKAKELEVEINLT